MNNIVYNIISLGLAGGMLYGIHLLGSAKTAVKGNALGACCVFAAIAVTLLQNGIIGVNMLWGCMLIGGLIGAYLSYRVRMIQMPQTVALLNGLGGGASALVAVTVLLQPEEIAVFSRYTAISALLIGGLTFSGSMIAAGKLTGKLHQKPIVYPGHALIANLSIFVMLMVILISPLSDPGLRLSAVPGAAVSLFFGFWFTLRIGGADMPITISLLNSLSGVAAAIAGLAVHDPLLVAVGGIVGASGLLLTQLMCRAMNRNLVEILTGKTTEVLASKPAAQRVEKTPEHVSEEKPTVGELLRNAKSVVIVPGYGMALAQAQSEVKQLADLLEENGKSVKFGIHPVAGRMPGHMYVLLAEVDVPYEKLYEMDAVNPEFKNTDLVVVVGANDVVNPAANTAEGTPIYGMPVLKVDEARNVVICNYDTQPGYAGVDNPLYRWTNSCLMLGDAKETVGILVRQLLEASTH